MIDALRIAFVLTEHPDVAEAEVVHLPLDGIDRPLAVVAINGFVTGAALRESLCRQLGKDEAAIGVLAVDLIPRRDGEVDAEAVGSLVSQAGGEVWFHAPADDLEAELATVWADALGLPGISVLDAFLDLGGDSLAAIRIVALVEGRFDVALGLDEMLEATVRGMAQTIRDRQAAPFAAEAM